jgi:hypothetical protein
MSKSEIWSIPARVKLKERIPAKRFEVDPKLTDEDRRQVQLLIEQGARPNDAELCIYNWKKRGSTLLPIAADTHIEAGEIVTIFHAHSMENTNDFLIRVETDQGIVGTTLLSKTEPAT